MKSSDPKADRFIGCALCSQGTPDGCKAPAVAGAPGAPAVPFPEARKIGGPCGPEALRFHRPGWTETECEGARK